MKESKKQNDFFVFASKTTAQCNVIEVAALSYTNKKISVIMNEKRKEKRKLTLFERNYWSLGDPSHDTDKQ